jgi:hypothetical protein
MAFSHWSIQLYIISIQPQRTHLPTIDPANIRDRNCKPYNFLNSTPIFQIHKYTFTFKEALFLIKTLIKSYPHCKYLESSDKYLDNLSHILSLPISSFGDTFFISFRNFVMIHNLSSHFLNGPINLPHQISIKYRDV